MPRARGLVGKRTKLFFLAFHSTHAISTLDALREIPRAGVQQEWRLSRVSVAAASVFFLFRLLLLTVYPLHLSSSRSKTASRCERAIHTFWRGHRSSDLLSKDYKPPALRRVPNMKYAIVETNPSCFANNGANTAHRKIFQRLARNYVTVTVIYSNICVRNYDTFSIVY